MLSKIIVSSYLVLLEISIWLLLIGSIGAGWYWDGVVGSIIGLVLGFIVAVTIFGSFLILGDIRNAIRAIEKHKLRTRDQIKPKVTTTSSSIAA